MSETTLKSKYLYKITLLAMKILPMIMSFSYLLMLFIYKVGGSYVVVPHIIGTVLAPLLFLYLTSYLFRYCYFHRLFIHYYCFVDIINVADHYGCLPFSSELGSTIHDIATYAFIISVIVIYIIKFKKDTCCNLGRRLINPLIK